MITGATMAIIEINIAVIISITAFTVLENPSVTASLKAFLTSVNALTMAALPPPNRKPINCFTMILLSPSVPVKEVKAM